MYCCDSFLARLASKQYKAALGYLPNNHSKLAEVQQYAKVTTASGFQSQLKITLCNIEQTS